MLARLVVLVDFGDTGEKLLRKRFERDGFAFLHVSTIEEAAQAMTQYRTHGLVWHLTRMTWRDREVSGKDLQKVIKYVEKTCGKGVPEKKFRWGVSATEGTREHAKVTGWFGEVMDWDELLSAWD